MTGHQASEVLLEDDVERVVVDLVGDLAAYRPHAKVVILEGANQDGFDVGFVRRLFPDFARHVNLVSAGSKRRVRDLYAVLDEAISQVGVENRFFAIVDRDAESYVATEPGTREFTWSVYHIENFLLSAGAVRSACASLLGADPFESDEAVMAALRTAASKLVGGLSMERIQAEVNNDLVAAINIGGPPDGEDVATDIRPSIEGSVERLVARADDFTSERLATRVDEIRAALLTALETEAWATEFPGRRILRRFVSDHLPGVGYEPFRNLVLDKMALSEERPEGMKQVLDQIAAA